jgi:hypothetical protein
LTYICKVRKLTITGTASVRRIRKVSKVSPVITMLLVFIISVFVDDGSNDGLFEEEVLLVVTSYFPANIVARFKILKIVISPSLIIFCFKFILSCKSSNEFYKFKVLEIVKSPSLIKSCFLFIAIATFPIFYNVKNGLTSRDPFNKRLLLIVPPVFGKYKLLLLSIGASPVVIPTVKLE